METPSILSSCTPAMLLTFGKTWTIVIHIASKASVRRFLNARKRGGGLNRPLRTDYVNCTITLYENGGLAIQIDDSRTCGAEAILTPKQREDFERVVCSFKNGSRGFTPMVDDRTAQVVSAAGKYTPQEDPS